MSRYKVEDVFEKEGVRRVLGSINVQDEDMAYHHELKGLRILDNGRSASITDLMPLNDMLADGWKHLGSVDDVYPASRFIANEDQSEPDPRDAEIAKLRSLLGEAADKLEANSDMYDILCPSVETLTSRLLAARLRKESGE